MKLGPEQSVQMPMKTVISLNYHGRTRHLRIFSNSGEAQLNQHSTKIEIMERRFSNEF